MIMPEEKKKIKYRVRDMSTGLYQDGGFNKSIISPSPKWSKSGKSWSKLAELKDHLRELEDNRIAVSPLWEVIETIAVVNELEGDRYPAIILATKNKS